MLTWAQPHMLRPTHEGGGMSRPIRETVAERVARLRHQAGLTQPQLAQLADCTLTTLNRVEKGRQSLYYEALAKLAEALGTTPDYLLGYSDHPRKPRPRPQPRRRTTA